MNEKYELVAYLSNLSDLLTHQESSGGNLRSATLAADYERGWEKLKTLINKEQEDEARKSNSQQRDSDKA